MKRFLVTILSVLYMASALSLSVHVHYCMGKIAGISFIHNDEGRCGKCGMEKAKRDKGCCKDEHKTFKTNDHQIVKASFDFSHVQIEPALTPVYSYYSAPVYTACINEIARTNAPPGLWRTCPIFIQVQNFRI